MEGTPCRLLAGRGWDAQAQTGRGASVCPASSSTSASRPATHSPSNACSRLCVRSGLPREASRGWEKERGGYDGSFRGCFSPRVPPFWVLSPLPLQQRGSYGGLGCLSLALGGCCPQHGDQGRAAPCGDRHHLHVIPECGHVCPYLETAPHTRLSSRIWSLNPL